MSDKLTMVEWFNRFKEYRKLDFTKHQYYSLYLYGDKDIIVTEGWNTKEEVTKNINMGFISQYFATVTKDGFFNAKEIIQ